MAAQTCEYCHGSGLALYVQDTATKELSHPCHHQGEAQLLIAQMRETKGFGAFHLYICMGACVCGGLQAAARNAGATRQTEFLRHALPEPGFSQFDGKSWESFKALGDGDKLKGLKAAYHMSINDSLNDKPGLALAGDVGVGKTGLMYLCYLARRDSGAIWTDYNEMISLIQSTYDRRGSDTARVLVALANTPWLFLDDMGDMARSVPVSDDKRDKTYDVLRVRHQKRLPTFITTNLNREQLAFQFGSRIASRIDELCVWIVVGGRNLRS